MKFPWESFMIIQVNNALEITAGPLVSDCQQLIISVHFLSLDQKQWEGRCFYIFRILNIYLIIKKRHLIRK